MKLKVFTNVKTTISTVIKNIKTDTDAFCAMAKNKRFLLVSLLCFVGLPFCLYLFCANADMRNVLINLGTALKGGSLNAEHWHKALPQIAATIFSCGIVFFVLSLVFFACVNYKAELSKAYEKFASLQWFFFAIYLIITFVAVLHHENWCDELNAWVYAKIKSIPALWHEMRYEGHFLPWYLLLMPFAKLGFPYITLSFISWTINAVTVFIFIKKAPFSTFTKVLLLATSPFIFWYPIVSRCYILIPIILYLLAILWEKPMRHPILFGTLTALLANTHAYIEGVVLAIFIAFLIENVICEWNTLTIKQKRERILALVIIFIGVLIAFLQVGPAFWSSSIIAGKTIHTINFREALGFLYGSRIPIKAFITIPFVSLLFLLDIFLFIRSKKGFLIFTIGCLYMLAFCTILYGAGIPNRALLWFFIVIFALWFTPKSCIKSRSIFLILFSIFLLNWRPLIEDYKYDFCPIHKACEIIKQKYPTDTPVFGMRTFIQLEEQLPGYKTYWSLDEFLEYKKANAGSGKRVLIMSLLGIDNYATDQIEGLYSCPFAEFTGVILWGPVGLWEMTL